MIQQRLLFGIIIISSFTLHTRLARRIGRIGLEAGKGAYGKAYYGVRGKLVAWNLYKYASVYGLLFYCLVVSTQIYSYTDRLIVSGLGSGRLVGHGRFARRVQDMVDVVT